MKILTAPRMERCIGCHSCSLACARQVHKLRAFAERRCATQPAKPSAGCFFRNPEQIPAGKLIDELGLKGLSVGGARVSELHANFIVNEGGATAADVLKLMTLVRERAKNERSIELMPEVMILGKDGKEA